MLNEPFPHVVCLTPPGRGAVATVLVEGPRAAEIVAANFHARGGRPLQARPDGRLVVGQFGAEPGDEVVVRCQSAESVELHCHGGHAAVAMIEEILVAAGGRPMSWQDWVAGQHDDAIAAAARLALAEARTERTAAILLDQFHGALRRAMRQIEAAVHRRHWAAAEEQIKTLCACPAGPASGPAVAGRCGRAAQRRQK